MAPKTKPAGIPADDLIDIEGAAKLIWVKPKTICNWLSAKKLHRFKAGRRTLVRRSEVLSLVREG